MSAVGGRMELVAPSRSLFAPDYLRIATLFAVSAAIHIWLLSHTAVTARDGIGFGRYAIGLQTPTDAKAAPKPGDTTPPKTIESALDVIASKEHHPGYPIAICLVAKMVRKVEGSEGKIPNPVHAVQYLRAAQIVSALAALLCVVPTYLIGRMLFGRFVGFGAALLFQVLPVPARVTSDALSEGTYLLALSVAVMLGVRAVRRPGVGGFLLTGLATGACYLVRPEGLIVAGAVGLTAGWLGLLRRWPRDVTLGRLAALTIGVALVAGPYCLFIGKLTQKPTPNAILPSFSPREQLMKAGGGAEARPTVTVGGPVFADYWEIPPDAGTIWRAKRSIQGVTREVGKALHYVGLGLAALGLVFYRRRIVAEPGECLLVVLAGLYVLLLIAVGMKGYLVPDSGIRQGYVSERYTLVIVMIGCVFAVASLEPLAAALASLPKIGRVWSGRFAPMGLLLTVVAVALPITLKPLHDHRIGHKYAGEWLAKNVKDEEVYVLIDPFEWAQWYSGRALHYIPTDPADAKVKYAILDDKEEHADAHSRLARMQAAKDIRANGNSVVVYHWPEDVPVSDAKVKIYKLVCPEGK